jgi:hypothetical protein
VSFEHAIQSEYQQLPPSPKQALYDEVEHLDDTINQIDDNLASPYFYHGDRDDVIESRELFAKRREEILKKLSTQTIIVASAAA